jgi:hypothetical protein
MFILITAQIIGLIMSYDLNTQYFPIVFEALYIYSLVYAR